MNFQGSFFMKQKEVNEAQEAMDKSGMPGLEQYMREKLDTWKRVPLNIAVTGNGGVGKSTFINTMRGVTPTDEGAAQVGVTESTTEVREYTHPHHNNFVFSDLPGVGTPDVPKERYLEKVGFEKFDFFLIFCSSRFTENDLWLAKEVSKEKKQFYFIRTKIDSDVRNDKEDHPDRHNENTLLSKLASDCRTKLEEGGLGTENHIFLISGKLRNIGKWDFPDLSKKLIESIPEIKRGALILSLQCNSKEIINKKCEVLQSRIWQVAALSAICGAVPVPPIGLICNLKIIVEEITEYKRQLGLDNKTLKNLAEQYRVDEGKLIAIVALENIPGAVLAALGFVKAYSDTATEEDAVLWALLGCITGATLSYGALVPVLQHFLDNLQKAALQIVKLTIEAGNI